MLAVWKWEKWGLKQRDWELDGRLQEGRSGKAGEYKMERRWPAFSGQLVYWWSQEGLYSQKFVFSRWGFLQSGPAWGKDVLPVYVVGVGLDISHLLHYTVSVAGFCREHFGVLGLGVMLPARTVLHHGWPVAICWWLVCHWCPFTLVSLVCLCWWVKNNTFCFSCCGSIGTCILAKESSRKEHVWPTCHGEWQYSIVK